MKTFSTRQVAKQLGITHVTLIKYIADKKIPAPKSVTSGGMTIHLWTDEEIEQVRKLLPKIANGRKTRHKKLREKQDAQPGAPQPQHAKSARAGDPKPVPHKLRKTTKKK
jgi:predicted DNA-binding transcriptional regulator AlpA